MHVLVFRHMPYEDVGLIAPALKQQGIELRYSDAFWSPVPPSDWRDASGLVLMGGPMSANDDLPFIHEELALVREAAGRGTPVLGVCLGAQILARALGGRVYPNPVKEIGWYSVSWTDAAASDALFRGLTGPEMIFHWHGETFDLPPGAEWLASSERCRNQAFRAGRGIYGLQFHLEVTPEMIEDWCRQDANAGDMREVTGPIDPHVHAARLAELAAMVFGRWAVLVSGLERLGARTGD